MGSTAAEVARGARFVTLGLILAVAGGSMTYKYYSGMAPADAVVWQAKVGLPLVTLAGIGLTAYGIRKLKGGGPEG